MRSSYLQVQGNAWKCFLSICCAKEEKIARQKLKIPPIVKFLCQSIVGLDVMRENVTIQSLLKDFVTLRN